MINFTVHTQWEDGSAATGRKVFLDIHSWPSSTWLEDYTDDAGDVDFEIDSSGSIEISFIVDGTTYQTESVENGDCIFITID
ncbi:MAG: hypothetical protein M0Q99_05920 [Candidatus Cloacimonetes bacterium]|jgi:hypothetical protein|nr:hypothetical protein [Candidatus Cloacimonadota bacterium]